MINTFIYIMGHTPLFFDSFLCCCMFVFSFFIKLYTNMNCQPTYLTKCYKSKFYVIPSLCGNKRYIYKYFDTELGLYTCIFWGVAYNGCRLNLSDDFTWLSADGHGSSGCQASATYCHSLATFHATCNEIFKK